MTPKTINKTEIWKLSDIFHLWNILALDAKKQDYAQLLRIGKFSSENIMTNFVEHHPVQQINSDFSLQSGQLLDFSN